MKKLFYAILWIIGLQLVGYLMGLLTQANITDWYHQLERSPLTPPDYIFGIAWGILYVCIALAGWCLWTNSAGKSLALCKKYFITQLLLNWLWTPVFFHFHLIGLAFWIICALILFTLLTITTAWQRLRLVSYLLLPYLGWLLFASYLNGYIWLMN